MKSIKALRVHPKIQIDSLVKTILSRCKKEKEWKCLHVPLEDNELRVACYTGLPIPEVYQCVGNSNDSSTASNHHDPLKNCDHLAIMICLRDMYQQKGLPTMQNIYEAVHASRNQNSGNYTANYDTFCQEVSLLGYRYIPLISGDCMIMEDPKLTFERYHYLKKIKKLRKRNVIFYYLDERIVGKNICAKRSDLVKDDYDKEMLFYVISRYGSEKGMFGHHTLVNDCIGWITDTLMPDLAPSSVIIINTHHGQSKNETITKYHSKKDMLTWLRNHNIPCSDEMHKAELYELIDKSSLSSFQSAVENVFKANGHTVLILPSSLQNFTPTELLWCGVQTELQKKNMPFPKTSQRAVCLCIESVSEEKWSLYEDTIVNQENLIYNIDLDVEKALEYYNLDPVYSAKLSCSDEYDINIVDDCIYTSAHPFHKLQFK